MRMFSLRRKLFLGFGGLLAVLFAVGAISFALLKSYTGTIDRISRENYDSVLFGQGMKDALDRLDDIAESLFVGMAPQAEAVQASTAAFEDDPRRETGHITIPGEREL